MTISKLDEEYIRLQIMETMMEVLEQGQSFPTESISNCCNECEWKVHTFDNRGIALTEYCEKCGTERDYC